ncbi:MAG: hypothetical protein NW237_14710 [Cyanobacteriota bacterium]|nr:hypothetical protein [Cyanobacteriota bacterium]
MRLPFSPLLHVCLTGSLLSLTLLLGSAGLTPATPSSFPKEARDPRHEQPSRQRFPKMEQPLPLKLGVTGLGVGLIVAELYWFLGQKSSAKVNQLD